MTKSNLYYGVYSRLIALLILMLLALFLSFYFSPTERMSVNRKSIDFSKLIPQQFDNWTQDKSMLNQLVDPEVSRTLESVYSQTLSRTYRNKNNQQIMLSIAYGGDQDEVMQVHKPEVCYTAQGFIVSKLGNSSIKTSKGSVSVKRILTKQAERVEPVTYWITIGNSIALDGLHWRWERIKYGLTGQLPDGLLFRVSSIGHDTNVQYDLHKMFIRDLFNYLTIDQVKQLIGNSVIN